jgi:hypothetical protein
MREASAKFGDLRGTASDAAQPSVGLWMMLLGLNLTNDAELQKAQANRQLGYLISGQ